MKANIYGLLKMLMANFLQYCAFSYIEHRKCSSILKVGHINSLTKAYSSSEDQGQIVKSFKVKWIVNRVAKSKIKNAGFRRAFSRAL